jgi:mannan endo-1,4-beta-mannosidase
MPSLRFSSVIASAATCLLATGGCLRQTGSPAMSSDTRKAALPSGPEGPVEESDRPTATFTLDGEPLCFAGTNNYYLTYNSRKMVDDVLDTTKSLGLKVIRIWAYLDAGSADHSVRTVDPNGDPDGSKNGVKFQYWDPAAKRPAYNDGATGMEHLDYVLDKAKKLDLKVMLVLTNNWKDFGGMDEYLVWYGLHEHQLFYTDPSVRQAYKNWAAHLIARKNTLNGSVYRDDPTIFGWELANEPRCISAGEFDHAAACKPPMVTQWVDEMSSYIRSLDPNHLISVGDEGFFASGSASHYDGGDGVDHEALLAVKNIDFGTFHLYPESWGHPVRWASKWIDDHIEAARAAGKPTLLEEYGIIARRDASGAIKDDERRRGAYKRWHDLVEKHGGAGALFWMLAGVDDTHGMYPDYDHFEMYSSDGAMSLVKDFAVSMGTAAQACKLYRKTAPPGTLPKSPFVGVSRPARPAGVAQSQNVVIGLPPGPPS